jgi:purine-nucleoside phosphorylase
MLKQLNETTTYLKERSGYRPSIGLILGSGLGVLADEIEAAEKYPYHEIPNFPVSTVQGHAGQLVIGSLEGKEVVAMQGRTHYYEGYSMQEITFPVRVMKALGVSTLIVTNACGALNPAFYPSALMVIKDHINLMGDNPLIGKNEDVLGPRFPDMSNAYPTELVQLAKKTAADLGIEVFEGVHASVSGPYYLSKAELRMVSRFGADTIGMSTIPEVIVATHAGIQSIGISCITDMAVPDEEHVPLTHERVMEIANLTRPKFIKLIKGLIARL